MKNNIFFNTEVTDKKEAVNKFIKAMKDRMRAHGDKSYRELLVVCDGSADDYTILSNELKYKAYTCETAVSSPSVFGCDDGHNIFVLVLDYHAGIVPNVQYFVINQCALKNVHVDGAIGLCDGKSGSNKIFFINCIYPAVTFLNEKTDGVYTLHHMKNLAIFEEHFKAKDDFTKAKLSLVPMQILYDIAAVREYGTKKYGDPNNWKNVEKERYIDAMLRHMVAFVEDPDGCDEESKLPHLWHLACNVSFLCDIYRKEINND